MEIKIECPWCNQHYSVDESYVGQKVECSVCEKEFVVSKPKESAPKEKTHTTDYFSDYFSKKENANSSNVSLNQNQKKQAFIPKRIIPKVIVAFSALVIVVIVLSVVYYTKVIPDRQYKNGLKAYAEKRYEDAAEYFKQAAELGHSKAKKEQQKAVAEINYQNGKKSFNKHRYEDAVNSFEKAADLGHSEAQLLLGMCYFNGDGIKRDYDEAAKWFRRGAEQKNQEAQYKLGLCYLAGIGVNPREEEAVFWLQKAAEQGHKGAQICLGDFYYDKAERQGLFSDEGKSNLSKALKWYQQAKDERGIWKCQLYLEMD